MKSSVISSVAGDEYSLEGIKVREVVKSSTFLPVPSGYDSEVCFSVYTVQETEEGLKVEIVTRKINKNCFLLKAISCFLVSGC